MQSSLLWLAARGVACGPVSASVHARKVAGAATSGARVVAAALAAESSCLCPRQSQAAAGWDSRPSSRTTTAGMPGWARPALPLPEGVLGGQGCFRGALRKGSAALGWAEVAAGGPVWGDGGIYGGLGGILLPPLPPPQLPSGHWDRFQESFANAAVSVESSHWSEVAKSSLGSSSNAQSPMSCPLPDSPFLLRQTPSPPTAHNQKAGPAARCPAPIRDVARGFSGSR